MKIEKERKYLLTEEQFLRLKEISFDKTVIVQWYMNDEDLTRYRVEFFRKDNKIQEKWTLNIKKEIDHENRMEVDEIIEKIEDIDKFSDAKFVAKYRHYISDDPEIIIDEYIKPENITYQVNDKNSGIFLDDVHYVLEIEEKETFIDNLDLFLRGRYFKSEDVYDVTTIGGFKNSRLAMPRSDIFIPFLKELFNNPKI